MRRPRAFAAHKPHLHPPGEVLGIFDHAARRDVKELLVQTGEKPEHNTDAAKRLHEYGHEDFTSHAAWTCESAHRLAAEARRLQPDLGIQLPLAA